MISAAVWSAIAATFAAISSLLIYRTQRQNYFLSVRPELVLEGWSRGPTLIGESEYDVLEFTRVRNIGRGPALHVHSNSDKTVDDKPLTALSTIRFPVIAVDEPQDVDGRMTLWWKNVVPSSSGHRNMSVTIEVLCWDLAGIRHETRYSLLVGDLADTATSIMADTIAPQVMLGTRTTKSTPIWCLKLDRNLKSLDPRKAFRNLTKSGKN